MNRWIYILMALWLSACSLEPREINVNQGDEFARNAYTPPVGIQTFRQVLASRSVIAGIQPKTGDTVMNTFNTSANLFSMDGDALTVSSPMVLAMGSLSAAFCDQTYDIDAAVGDSGRRLFRHVPTGQASAAFSASARTSFVNHLFQRALQREPSAEERAVVVRVLSEAYSGGAPLREGAVAACAAVLASLETWSQ